MTRYRFEPEWRGGKQPIEVHEHLALKEYVERWDARVVRFCVSDSGRLVSGDARTVLHADILRVSMKLGEHGVLTVGVLLRKADAWHVWLQALDAKRPAELLLRLLPWRVFVQDESVVFERGWNDEL